jgi:hypothetical protein
MLLQATICVGVASPLLGLPAEAAINKRRDNHAALQTPLNPTADSQ